MSFSALHGTSQARSSAIGDVSMNVSNWGQGNANIVPPSDMRPDFSGFTFGDFGGHGSSGPLIDPALNTSHHQRPQMTTLLGEDFVFNNMSLPNGHNGHTTFSFVPPYQDHVPSPIPPSSTIPVKRTSIPHEEEPPTKKPTQKRKEKKEGSQASRKRATGKAKDPFIAFTFPGGQTPSLPPNTTSSVDTTPPAKQDDKEEDADDNEAALAEEKEKVEKKVVELLPQEIPPFELYTEPLNPLALWGFKHRTIDLPVTYLDPESLPGKVKGRPSMWFGEKKGKLDKVADEWDKYLKDVALEILTTEMGNIICPYHHWVSKKIENDVQFQTHGPKHYFVTGVPGVSRVKRVLKGIKKAVSKVKKVKKLFKSALPEAPETPDDKQEDDKPLEREPSKLHCGCIEDEVLLELILWKSTLQQSPATGVVETWQDAFLHPRDRTFVLRAYVFWTGLKADILYEFDADGNRRDMVDIARHQVAFFEDRLRRAIAAKEDLSGIIPDIDKLETVSFNDDDEAKQDGDTQPVPHAEEQEKELSLDNGKVVV
ncbi:hypothetical protein NP233_g11420 [Leucocoprinus birnbaumii]|uniref:Uncharacterized protein n=1 Tax=Leucocoprinus birnbaumii TaxID=56174 RepID=A0AAD5VK61_9AGAR|nr:hypothetical protein NP233_g11420 [Leucocoprinus birnbaumii]